MVATTTSDANGNYEFDNLFPGTFTVEEILQAGWTQTQPVNPNYYQFTTQSGLNETGLNFGNFINSENLSGDGLQRPERRRLATTAAPTPAWPAGRSTCSTRAATSWRRPPAPPTGPTRSPTCRSQPTRSRRSSRPAGSSPSRPTRRERTRFPAAQRRLHRPRLRQLPARQRFRQRLQRPQRQRQPGSGRPGLQSWTVDVYNAGGTVVASAVTRRQRELHDPERRPRLVHSPGGRPDRLVPDPAGQPGLLLVHVLQRRERRGRDLRQLPHDHRQRQRLQRPGRQRPERPAASRAWQAGRSTSRIPAATCWPRCSPTPAATTRSPAWAAGSTRSPRSCRPTGCRPSRSTRRSTASRPRAVTT